LDLITKAVERARTEQGAAAHRSPVAVPLPAAAPAAPANDLSQIVYSQTRVIAIPRNVLLKRHIITPDSADEQVRPYKILRTRVLQKMRENGWNTLAVTSANPGEGKTLTAVNLAISIAMEVACTVVLVDLDLMRPGVHRTMGFKTEHGIVDYLRDDVPLENVLVNPGIARFVVLPGSKPLRDSSEMLSSPKMAELVQELKNRYPSRFVIFDMPPLRGSDDMLAFAPCVDAVLLVVEEGKTQIDDLQRASSVLANMNLVGTVLNKSVEERVAYY